jgi:hypothetical protein
MGKGQVFELSLSKINAYAVILFAISSNGVKESKLRTTKQFLLDKTSIQFHSLWRVNAHSIEPMRGVAWDTRFPLIMMSMIFIEGFML